MGVRCALKVGHVYQNLPEMSDGQALVVVVIQEGDSLRFGESIVSGSAFDDPEQAAILGPLIFRSISKGLALSRTVKEDDPR